MKVNLNKLLTKISIQDCVRDTEKTHKRIPRFGDTSAPLVLPSCAFLTN